MFTLIRASIALVTMIALSALAADTNLDTTKSSLIATFKQEGVAVDAPFTKFTGRIFYDPANISAASAELAVETGSLDMGDEAYNAEVRKKSWFDSGGYPKATFTSTAIKPTDASHFIATGALSIKGKSITLTVPVTVTKAANVATFDGSLVISRATFGIGDPAWNDVLDDKVSVRFHLVNATH